MLKERAFLGFGVVAAGLAGFGALELCWIVFGREMTFSPAFALVVFFATLAIAIRAHGAVRAERLKRQFSNTQTFP